MRVQRTKAKDGPEEDVAHRAEVAVYEFVFGKYLDQSARERANAMVRILGVQFEGMLERAIAVGDDRIPLREEVADAVDGFSKDRREIASAIVRD